MTIDYCDPNDAPVQQWNPTGCTNHEDCVDDAVRQPTNPSTSTNIKASVDEQSAVDQFTMDNSITNISEATQIIFWANARCTNLLSKDFYMDIYIAGSWVGYTTKSLTTSQAWYSKTIGGSWSQAQIDALQVRVRSDSSIGTFHLQYCYEVYCEVTYTEPAVGYGHKVNGVAPTNIAKINGVATANIGKVNGV